jgi:hypothetical protein
MSIYTEEKPLPDDIVREEDSRDKSEKVPQHGESDRHGEHDEHEHECDCRDEDGNALRDNLEKYDYGSGGNHATDCPAHPSNSGEGEGEGGEGGEDDPIVDVVEVCDARSIVGFINKHSNFSDPCPRIANVKAYAQDDCTDNTIGARNGILAVVKHKSGKHSMIVTNETDGPKLKGWKWTVTPYQKCHKAIPADVPADEVDEVEGEGFKIVGVLDCGPVTDWLFNVNEKYDVKTPVSLESTAIGFIGQRKPPDMTTRYNAPRSGGLAWHIGHGDNVLVRLSTGEVAVITRSYFETWYGKAWKS